MKMEKGKVEETYMMSHIYQLREYKGRLNELVCRLTNTRNKFMNPSKGQESDEKGKGESKIAVEDNIKTQLDVVLTENSILINKLTDVIEDLETVF